MFTPPNENLIFTVHRIRTTYIDPVGNTKIGIGTGFWITSPSAKKHFITNKHNLVPSFKFSDSPELILYKVEIELRKVIRDQGFPEKCYFELTSMDCIKNSPDSDCSIIISPKFINHDLTCYPIGDIAKYKDLATEEEFMSNQIKVMEPAVFLGYPGLRGKHWIDSNWGLPIARQCLLASWPNIPFEHNDIPTKDTLLVSGMSFSGSSGSPVYIYNRGIRPGGTLEDANWRPTKLIGIMSGHFLENEPSQSMFYHSGLSYITRSTSIIDLLKTTNNWQ